MRYISVAVSDIRYITPQNSLICNDMSLSSDTTLKSSSLPKERSLSPFSIASQTKPHTSISSLPELPPNIKSTALARQRKCSETQKELKTKVKLLGTKVAASGNVEGLSVILDSIRSAGDHDIINIRNEVGYNMLHYAVAYGHEKVVKLLLDHGADPNCGTEDLLLETPLILAVKYARNIKERLNILDLLLKEKVNVNSENRNGDTALLLATDMQNVAVFEYLIGIKNIEIEKSNLKGDTPLIIAASHNNVEMVNKLLAHEANIYAKNKLGHNSVHVACINGSSNVLQVILREHSLECNRILRERDLQGNTPLLLAKAAPCNASILVEYLMSINADIRVSNYHGSKLLHFYNEVDDVDLCEKIIDGYPDLLEDTNHDNETPLHIATKLGYKDTARLLIEKGANLFAKDYQGFTPLMVATETGQKDMLKIMLDTNSNILGVNEQINASIVLWALENDHVILLQAIWEQDHQILLDSQRLGLLDLTLLHISAGYGATKSTKKLLSIPQIRALLNVEDKKMRFPVHIAAEKGHLQVCIALCEAEATINIGDRNGNTPLHYACSNGHIQIVKYLIQNGGCLERRNALEYDAVACSAAEGHDNVLHYLLSLGQSPNGTAKACPIILASSNGHIKCVKMLLNHQHVDISMTNTAGYNCLAEAIRNGHKELTFAILSSEHWKVAMRMSTKDGITPMRLMVQKMPDAAELVLNKSITLLTKEEQGHYTVSEIDYSYEFIEDFQDHQGKGYYQLSSIFTPKQPTFVLENNIAMDTVENGGTVTLNDDDACDKFPVKTHKPRKKNNIWGPKRFKKENHVIKLMVDYKRTQLLQHPLVAELLTYKWRLFGFPWFFLHLFIFMIYLSLLTTFALLLPLPTDSNSCRLLQFIEGSNTTNISVMMMDSSNDNRMDGMENRTISCPGLTDSRISSLRGITGVLWLLTFIGFLFELIQLIHQKSCYFVNTHNYIEITLYLAVAFFIQVDPNKCWCAEGIRWQIGAGACALAWLNLVIILKRLPFTGIPINMMINIIWTFISLALLPILLILTFALPFFMLFANPKISAGFESFPKSYVRTLVMTTGEFDFGDTFFNSTLPYPVTTFALWVIFIIVMPVLFNNLLVGLAVGDIQDERDKALLTEFDLQVQLALTFEESLPIARRFWYKNSDKFYPITCKLLQKFQNKFSTTFKERIVNNSEQIKSTEKILMESLNMDPLDEVKDLIEKQENEIFKLKAMMQERSEEQDRLLQKILSSVENPSSTGSQLQPRSKKCRLQKSHSLDIDDSTFPLLPQ